MLVVAGLLFGVLVYLLSSWPAEHAPLFYCSSFLVVVATMLLSTGVGCFYLSSQVVRRTD
ncbi:hypothetical protein Poly59_28620 [Rubripirellula reticaptiva]|uniref:Uncharacterized protein n=2 Tax=Rubripirellula reticaptiva TaxID=2528013 RepID=A0A5C6ESH4_9BACT|nr:hypothetical protein Poly59_28620 [Rubripirellula reticaptiva]